MIRIRLQTIGWYITSIIRLYEVMPLMYGNYNIQKRRLYKMCGLLHFPIPFIVTC